MATLKEYFALQKAVKAQKKKKRNKYNAKKCVIDGYTFDSLKEGRFYQAVKREEGRGFVAELELHPKYPIYVNNKLVCHVELDFRFCDLRTGKIRYIDVKGVSTAMSRLKKKMVEAQYGINVEWIK